METELRDTSEKLRKTMEQQARQQSEYMTTKEQLNSIEKAKVREISPIKKCFHFVVPLSKSYRYSTAFVYSLLWKSK